MKAQSCTNIFSIKLNINSDFQQPTIRRLYRVHAAGASIHLEPVVISPNSLDPGYVFILDIGNKIFMWYGKNAKNTLKSKSRLMAEKINKNERKNKAEIATEIMGSESDDFWSALNVDEPYHTIKVINFQLYTSLS